MNYFPFLGKQIQVKHISAQTVLLLYYFGCMKALHFILNKC